MQWERAGYEPLPAPYQLLTWESCIEKKEDGAGGSMFMDGGKSVRKE